MINAAHPADQWVPTAAVLVHQPPLHDQAEVVHRSLVKILSQAEVDPPSTGHSELRLAGHPSHEGSKIRLSPLERYLKSGSGVEFARRHDAQRREL
jgi:hypothetical protein